MQNFRRNKRNRRPAENYKATLKTVQTDLVNTQRQGGDLNRSAELVDRRKTQESAGRSGDKPGGGGC